jgi:hypothetical protein
MKTRDRCSGDLGRSLPRFFNGTLFGQCVIDRQTTRFRRKFAEMWGRFPRRPVTPVITDCTGRRSVMKTRDRYR